MGDPGGVGPEVLVKALADSALRDRARFVIHGSSSAMHAAADRCEIEPMWWRVDRDADPVVLASAAPQGVVLLDSDTQADSHARPHGGFSAAPTKRGGQLSYRWVNDAIAQCQRDERDPLNASAIVTGPISKEAWALAGHKKFPGHTELLGSRFKAKRFGMMFEGPSLRVILVTTHIPLMDVRDVLTIGRVFDTIELGAQGCRQMGVKRPKIAVCGLNPHAGEGGLFGDEETRLIEPAIEHAVRQGIDVSGPYPADTVFNAAVAGRYDLVVAMYHDQGLIPVKLLARDSSVNVTVGLPIVRTSPDHGTAFDIAGRGVAEEGSMKNAIELAIRMLDRGVCSTVGKPTQVLGGADPRHGA
ncbi:MAG: 4-hydroxythreonine-4-phosphate dehydrogenase [Phycisphaerales bacterium]|jgi:4-hydroxythreonine-4-phosphate dehydrogenase